MRLLNTHTGRFESCDDPQMFRYAILSHVWEKDEDGRPTEQTYEAVDAIHQLSETDVVLSSLSKKIQRACAVAREHGFHYIWIDTCCINKTSSAELSKAINSMFNWYRCSKVCYVFLSDVDDRDDPHYTHLLGSNWFKRGWTLQELIAPASVLFVTSTWKVSGSRADLAECLWQVTGIPPSILTRRRTPSDYSVCTRMRWASQRQTTRLEDEAYCLMGLFDVSMPTNYGEGERAFTRLQYEIMRKDTDLSLFAFGPTLPYGAFSRDGISLSPGETPSFITRFLLASSPRQFDHASVYTPNMDSNARYPYPPSQVSR